MTGVQVVREGDLIAVLHELHDVAERALGAIKATYSADEKEVDDHSIFSHLLTATGDIREREKAGNLEAGEDDRGH